MSLESIVCKYLIKIHCEYAIDEQRSCVNKHHPCKSATAWIDNSSNNNKFIERNRAYIIVPQWYHRRIHFASSCFQCSHEMIRICRPKRTTSVLSVAVVSSQLTYAPVGTWKPQIVINDWHCSVLFVISDNRVPFSMWELLRTEERLDKQKQREWAQQNICWKVISAIRSRGLNSKPSNSKAVRAFIWTFATCRCLCYEIFHGFRFHSIYYCLQDTIEWFRSDPYYEFCLL